MKTIIGRSRTRLSLLVAWSIAGLAWNGATAQDSTLKDNLGRTIEVRIISATKTHVVCIKASDTKEVTIALDSLDAESQKRINDWRIESGRLPRKEFSFIATLGREPENFQIKFKMPEGNYNSSPVGPNLVSLQFDVPNSDSIYGQFTLSVTASKKNRNGDVVEIFLESEEIIKKSLGRMTPSDRSAYEASMKLLEVSHGDFKGYRFPMNPLNGLTAVRMTNGKFRVYATLRLMSKNQPAETAVQSAEAQVQPDDIAKILGTVEIVRKP